MNHDTFCATFLLINLLSISLCLQDIDKEGPSTFEELGNTALLGAKVTRVPDEFERIQEAINNAADGDAILVRPGTYAENIVVNRSVFLVGANQDLTFIEGRGNFHVVTIATNNVVLSGFTIQNGGFPNYGVQIRDVVNSIVQCNTVINNFVGIMLRNAGSNQIRWNNISKNRFGIFLAHSTKNIIYANSVSNNEWNGIELDWCERNVIEANTFAHNVAYGLEIPINTPARSNDIYHNSFINNSYGVSVSGYSNTWDDGYPSGGNFWGGYVGVDEFGGWRQGESGSDGIGDAPYTVDSSNVDHYPLMAPFSPTPASTPAAIFTYSPEKPCAGEVITFDASMLVHDAESIVGCVWDFGDGASSKGCTVYHTYASSGAYTVELHVVSNEGLLGTEFQIVTVEDQPTNVVWYVMTAVATTIIIVAICIYFGKSGRLRRLLHKHNHKNNPLTSSIIRINNKVIPQKRIK